MSRYSIDVYSDGEAYKWTVCDMGGSVPKLLASGRCEDIVEAAKRADTTRAILIMRGGLCE